MSEKLSMIQVLQTGLKGTSARSKTIANNLANFNTPGYRRKDVNFEGLLKKAIACNEVDELKCEDFELFETRNTPADATGNDVHLEQEIGEMLKNSARYKTMMRVMSKIYRQMEMATRTE